MPMIPSNESVRNPLVIQRWEIHRRDGVARNMSLLLSIEYL